MPNYQAPHTRVRRIPKRGHYDAPTVHAILDAGFVGHVSFQQDGHPFQIPMLYAREGDRLYLHGSGKSRIYQTLAAGTPCSLGVTHVDGLVLAKSALHHSVNYRSVVVFGTCTPVTDPARKMEVFELITDTIIPGRFAECRPMHAKEAEVTGLLELRIEAGSAKVRAEGAHDDAADAGLDIWAGVVPVVRHYGTPQPEETAGPALPESVRRLLG